MGQIQHDRPHGLLNGGMKQRIRLGGVLMMAALILTGCAQNELGRYSGYYKITLNDPKRVRNPIVKSENYWIQKEVVPEELFPGPTPGDLKSPETDYILGAGDLIDITVFELMAPGQPYISRQRVSQSGQITFPYLGAIKAAGLTTRGLEEKLSDLLEPDYLTNPQINVFVGEFHNLNVSVLNGVARAGLYPMTKQDMTLLELVAMSGGIMQLVEDYGYVIRKYAPDEVDMLMLEEGLPPPKEGEGAAKAEGGEKKAEGEKKAPSEKAPKGAEKTPKGGEKAPKGAEKAAPAAKGAEPPAPAATLAIPAAPAAPAVAPAAPAAPSKGTASEAAPAPAKDAPAKEAPATAPKASADQNRDARQLLERMAEGDMPAVKSIEMRETVAEKKASVLKLESEWPPVTASKSTVAERKSALALEGIALAATDKPAAPAEEPKSATGTTNAPSKDEKELGRWIWSDGKWVEVKGESPGAPAMTIEAPKPPEPKTPGTSVKPAEVKKPGEVKKPVEAAPTAKPAEGAVPPENAMANLPESGRLQLEQKLRRLGVVQGSGQLRRIIRFDVRALQAGDPTQNIVLRDADVVTIPSPEVGDFYMAGEVARPGVYSLTGRKITLLQGVAAAGGMSAVAVPWRTEVVRRISQDEEEIIYVDLLKISRGEVPDFYLQPEDLVRVGTDEGAIFNAVIRNAFRATYGVGAVYDMNFADFYPWAVTRRAFFN